MQATADIPVLDSGESLVSTVRQAGGDRLSELLAEIHLQTKIGH